MYVEYDDHTKCMLMFESVDITKHRCRYPDFFCAMVKIKGCPKAGLENIGNI